MNEITTPIKNYLQMKYYEAGELLKEKYAYAVLPG